MRLVLGVLTAALLWASAAFGQANGSSNWETPGKQVVGGVMQMGQNASNQAVPFANSLNGNGPALLTTVGPYPFATNPITASATGSTGAISATLPASVGQNTYICGFSFQGSDATAAVAGNIAVTGTISGTMNFGYVALAAGATVPQPGPITVAFNPCVRSSAQNTAIVVTPPTLGTGATIATVSAWGLQGP